MFTSRHTPLCTGSAAADLVPLLLMAYAAAVAGAAAAADGMAPANCSLPLHGHVLGSTASFAHHSASGAPACCSLCVAEHACAAFNFEPDAEGGDGVCYLQRDARPCEPPTSRRCAKPDVIAAAVPGRGAGGGGNASSGGVTVVSLGSVYHHVDSRFKSWNMDASGNREWETRNLSRSAPGSQKLYNLARAYTGKSGSYLRFGGGGNDHLAYVMPGGPPPYINCTAGGPPDDAAAATKQLQMPRLGKQPWHCLNTTWLANLLDFANFSGAELVFGLDIDPRAEATGRWDPAPARALIKYAIGLGYKFFGFELGNESGPDSKSGKDAAADFAILYQLLTELFPDASSRPKIIGPDPNGWHSTPTADDKRLAFMNEFASELQRLKVPLFAMTHHEYIEIDQNSPQPIAAAELDKTGAIAKAVNASLAHQGVAIWAGEIGPHNGGSVPCDHTSMRWANFASTFWYLDAMAAKAAHGYSAFCRQVLRPFQIYVCCG